jgi:sigma-B regulation protein RsbU (phosphoserine phosphatase)
MRPGSRVVIFSDGLTDAQNSAEQEFGEERLIASCRTIGPAMNAEGVAEKLMQAVAEWSTGTDTFDDTTVVVVDVTRNSAEA